MAKKRTETAKVTTQPESPDVFDQVIADQKAAEVTGQNSEQATPSAEPETNRSRDQAQAPANAPKPRTTIAVPSSDGGIARYFDDGNASGVSIRIDHPDENFRPSAHVNEPLKEEHAGRNKMRWDQGRWRKGVRNNPVAERLDGEDRFEEMVRRRKAELEADGQER